ncbi:MAG: glutamine amidotransferase [Bacilli bacterium]|nr:glutamine amidotransferase [Bacilli bacterium]
MKLTLAYLYYDLLNLYGENGNIKILKKQLENIGVKVNVVFLSIDDELDFNNYDFVYIGCGIESNQLIVLKHLLKYKNQIKEAIENGKLFLATGNAVELFGKHIINQNKKVECLNIFNYETKHEAFKITDESYFIDDNFKMPFIGFQNRIGVMKNIDYPWFKVIKGIGSMPNSNIEGVHYKNFYGTYLIGPLLVRNPHFLKFVIKQLIKYKNIKTKKINLAIETKAYHNFIDCFYKETK